MNEGTTAKANLMIAIVGAFGEAIRTAESENTDTLNVPVSHAKLILENLDMAITEALAGRGTFKAMAKLSVLLKATQKALDAQVELNAAMRAVSVIGFDLCDDDQDNDTDDDQGYEMDDDQEEDDDNDE